ncbi:Cytosol aminopeptidase [Thelohanellus kitauei]|uniref:Cytosol aminopeptidase n=1 Tax=Thelohanellus kitauei TaxID=669202 RepID=A0A0C2I839_THEKT|nr:Cytosol aminopeptidase [Thelohanellus kitauei]
MRFLALLNTPKRLGFDYNCRFMSTLKGLVLGGYFVSDSTFDLTPASKEFDKKLGGKLTSSLKSLHFDGKLKKQKLITLLSEEYPIVVVTGLGNSSDGYCPVEEIDIKRENIRTAIYLGIKTCEDNDVSEIVLDDCDYPDCVGEAAGLSIHDVGQWKSTVKTLKRKTSLLRGGDNTLQQKFQQGLLMGESQCLAATLAETPANLKTPTKIADHISSVMPDSVKCTIRDKDWIKSKKMNLFLSVNQGSVEPPVLLEACYKGSTKDPIVLVGKGITFDSGGISLKPSQGMTDMKADMMGAAVVFATIRAAALMKLPIHLVALAPFTENLPSGSATKPGDVFTAMSGKTVEVDNTDAEGRLVLGDTLHYAESFTPAQVIDLATLTGAIAIALGSAASAIYTRCPKMLDNFKKSAALTGDRVWHMPLFREYSKMIESKVADLVNSTKKREAGSCTAAMFLSEFVKTKEWAHFDIAGLMTADKEFHPYCPGGMTGRPTRTLIEYLRKQSGQ